MQVIRQSEGQAYRGRTFVWILNPVYVVSFRQLKHSSEGKNVCFV